MPVYLNAKIYDWFKQIGVFRNEPITTRNQNIIEVPYDEEIYLQNGYLIGFALRKFVKPYSDEYQELLKVRKIALLTSSQNWEIIQPYLLRIGCDSITTMRDDQSEEIQISTQKIAEILQALHEQYCPKQNSKFRVMARIRKNFLDIHNFSPSKQLNEAQNSLQVMCILLTKCLKVTLSQALGLLVDKSKYLKKLIVEGSQIDQFDQIKIFYEQATLAWPILKSIIGNNTSDLDKVLEPLSQGVLSECKHVIHSTLNLLSFVTDEDWFMRVGYYKLLSSPYIQCFYFTVERLTPNYNKLLNQQLHTKIQSKYQLLAIFYNLLQILPKTIFSKQVLHHMPLSYFYQQCYTILNIEQIDDQPPKLVMLAKELVMKLVITYPDRIANMYHNKILETFKYSAHRSYAYNTHNLALLFQILEALMVKESPLLERFFKVVMKYISSAQGETRYWVIDNLHQIYKKLSKSFPIGCMLGMYSLSSIGQPVQYAIFDAIADDKLSLTPQQCCLTLNFIEGYIKHQLHCKCFINILNKFLKNHFTNSRSWCDQASVNLLNGIQQLPIPILNAAEVNILNPKPPTRNRVINSIGLKRKEMLKYEEFDLFKKLLQQLGKVKDKNFLLQYIHTISHCIVSIEKQIGHKKKQLVRILKQLRQKVKKLANSIQESQPMSEIVKSILINKSRLSKQINYEPSQFSGSLTQSKLISNFQSRVQPHQVYDDQQKHQNYFEPVENSIIQEQQDQDNQFLSTQNNIKQQPINNYGLKTWKQDSFNKDEQSFYDYQSLEQHQIAYINSWKDQNSSLIQICSEIFMKYLKTPKSNAEKSQCFASQIGLANLMSHRIVEPLFLYCLKLNCSLSSKVVLYLLHSAVNIFSFKQARRVQITCFSSLLTLIIQKLNQNPEYRERLSKRKNDGPFIRKHVRYQHQLSNMKNVSKSKFTKYQICFEVLSDVVFQALGMHLVEPYSKQMNELVQNSAQQSQNRSLSPPPQLQQEEQIQKLQRLLEVSPSSSIDYRIQKPAARKLKSITSPIEQNKSISKADNKQLRAKLTKRLQILNSQVEKSKQIKKVTNESQAIEQTNKQQANNQSN